MKLCNNLVLAVSMLAVSEGMLLGAKLGVEPKTLAQACDPMQPRLQPHATEAILRPRPTTY